MPTNPNHVPSRRLAEMAFRDLVLRRRRGEDCVVEDVAKDAFFDRPRSERAQQFLSRILAH